MNYKTKNHCDQISYIFDMRYNINESNEVSFCSAISLVTQKHADTREAANTKWEDEEKEEKEEEEEVITMMIDE